MEHKRMVANINPYDTYTTLLHCKMLNTSKKRSVYFGNLNITQNVTLS